jgi:hypothetical protein
VLAIELSILMALSAVYGDGHSKAGAGAGIAFIFIFSASYALFFNSTTYVIAAEILPQHLRSYGMGVAFACQGISSLWLNQVTPVAFAAIHWKFYAVFISLMTVSAGVIWWGLPETYNITLEEIAVQFGGELKAGRMEDIMISSGKEKRAQEEEQQEQEQVENVLGIQVPSAATEK